MRLVQAGTTLLLSAACLWPQPSPIATQQTAYARQLLRSTSWMDKAWGAYLAGKLRSSDLRDDLAEAFRMAEPSRRAQIQSEEYAYVAALFDAAIDSGITVPASLLESFEENWHDSVLILLSRGADGEDALLRLAGQTSPPVWLAANNLLLERKSERWYRDLLSQVEITHRFTVLDSNGGRIGGGIGCGGFCSDGALTMPKGFPPIAVYHLRVGAEKGGVLLAEGPQDSYYVRTVLPTNQQVGFGSCASGLDQGHVRIGYLARLAGMPSEQLEPVFRAQTPFVYSGVQDFLTRVEAGFASQQQNIRAVIQKIREGGVTTTPGLRRQIVPEVVDRRQTPVGPLPAVAPKEIVLN